MRPRIVAAHGDSTSRTTLHREQHSMIDLRAAVVVKSHMTHQRAVLRPFHIENPPRIRIGSCRAGIVRNPVQGARAARNVDRRIDRFGSPDMLRLVSDVTGGSEPVCPNLLLDTQVPG